MIQVIDSISNTMSNEINTLASHDTFERLYCKVHYTNLLEQFLKDSQVLLEDFSVNNHVMNVILDVYHGLKKVSSCNELK